MNTSVLLHTMYVHNFCSSYNLNIIMSTVFSFVKFQLFIYISKSVLKTKTMWLFAHLRDLSNLDLEKQVYYDNTEIPYRSEGFKFLQPGEKVG